MEVTSRRSFLRSAALAISGAAAGSVLAACQPKVVEKIVKETVVVKEAVKETVVVKEAVEVEKEVTRVVEKVVEQQAAPKEQVTIRFHARIGEQENKLYGMQMPKFMDFNPNIKIELENFPGGEYLAKISTMHAGGSIGDVIWGAIGGATIHFLFSQGVVAPIDDLVAAQGFNTGLYYPGGIKALTIDGKLTGLPFKAHPGSANVYYNQALFAEAGIDVPQPDWERDDMVTMAKAIQEIAGDRPVFGTLMESGWKALLTGIRAWGGQLLSPDGMKFQLNSEEGLASVNWLYELFQVHKVSPTPEQIIGGTSQMWTSGNLGMFQAGTWACVLRNTIGDKFKWMVVNNPIGPAGVGGSDFEVDCDSITMQSKHPDEAFEWVKFICNEDSGVLLGVIGGTIGGTIGAYNSPVLLTDPVRPVFRDIMVKAQDSIIVGNWRQSEVESTLTQLLQPLWVGQEKPTKVFIDGVVDQIQAIIDKPKP
jgi:ABC-type glycerol-3-phosphate transport system substrate-binding protein